MNTATDFARLHGLLLGSLRAGDAVPARLV